MLRAGGTPELSSGQEGWRPAKHQALRGLPAPRPQDSVWQRPRGPTPSAQRALPAHPAPLLRACPAPAQPPGTLTITAVLLLGEGPGAPAQLQLGGSCSFWWTRVIRAASSNHGGDFSALCSDPGDSRPEEGAAGSTCLWAATPPGPPQERHPVRAGRQRPAWSHPVPGCVGLDGFIPRPGEDGHSASGPLTAAHRLGRQSTDLSVCSQGETEAPRLHHEDRASD